MADRLGIVQKLLAIRKTPVSVLDAVGQSLPKTTWLENIDVKFDENSVKMTGLAFRNEQVSDLVDKLSESIYLEDVKLQTVRTKKLRDVEVKTFEITANPRDGGSK